MVTLVDAAFKLVKEIMTKHYANERFLQGDLLPETLPLPDFIRWGQDCSHSRPDVLLYFLKYFAKTEDPKLVCIASWATLRRVLNQCDGNPSCVETLRRIQAVKTEWEASLEPLQTRKDKFEAKVKACRDKIVTLSGKMVVAALDHIPPNEFIEYRSMIIACMPEDIGEYIREHATSPPTHRRQLKVV